MLDILRTVSFLRADNSLLLFIKHKTESKISNIISERDNYTLSSYLKDK